ncbi:two-component system sensor histidine kinase MprB [Streptacidiphilus sp. MAP12-20]|uniref:sensor histidine kinase n=1 Tax=Streptacidiphilus sp. MAP12-20 TaxID=3156299 RepID=UPI003516A88F
MSLRNRVALAGGLVVLAALLLASLVLYPTADRDLHDQLDSSLVSTASTSPQFSKALKQKIADSGGSLPFTSVLDIGGTLVQFLPAPVAAGKAELAGVSDRDVEVAAGNSPAYFSTVDYQGSSYRLYTSLFDGHGGTLVRVARPLSDTTAPLRRLQLLLVALVTGGALTAAFAARLLAGRLLRPVSRLTETVEHVTVTQDLTARMDDALTGAGGRDEIGRLARSFSAMMGSLNGSVSAQRQLVADASHELRTPLTSLTTNLELLAEPDGLADPQAPELVRAALEQSGELKRLVNDLVDLARYGQTETHAEEVRLDLLAQEVVDRAARRNPGLRLAARLPDDPESCLVLADAEALARALSNLVDNAAKWSPDAGAVHVTVDPAPEERLIRCTVTDEGPGIADTDQPFVFDRFYRATAARSKPGSGLGLSIVRQIAETHGGTVIALPSKRGARLELTLPLLLPGS